jgi:hypothetical protein
MKNYSLRIWPQYLQGAGETVDVRRAAGYLINSRRWSAIRDGPWRMTTPVRAPGA